MMSESFTRGIVYLQQATNSSQSFHLTNYSTLVDLEKLKTDIFEIGTKKCMPLIHFKIMQNVNTTRKSNIVDITDLNANL